MKNKINLAFALTLFALGINQADAATVYFSCSGGGDFFDLEVDTVTGWMVGPRGRYAYN
jgi:hypothetical protein